MKIRVAATALAALIATASTAHAWSIWKTESGPGGVTTIYHLKCNNGRYETVGGKPADRWFSALGRIYSTLDEAARAVCGE